MDAQTVSNWLNSQQLQHEALEVMGKQASGREYFRVLGSEQPMVVMYTPVEDKPAEIGGDVAGEDLPFRHVRSWMEAKGLPVPREYIWDADARFLALEDLGPLTLEAALTASGRSMESLYGEAVDLLAQLHERCKDAGPDDLPGLAKRFDGDFLRWELDHFREWLIDERRGEPLGEKAREALDPRRPSPHDAHARASRPPPPPLPPPPRRLSRRPLTLRRPPPRGRASSPS